ncbi:MAG: UDP-N-acetylmuramoyl-L-alanine--D-glutamate ligase [Verrucomicrobiota bacterium]
MHLLANKSVYVAGLGASGRAACALLLRRGARVTAADAADTEALRQVARELRAQGVSVTLGAAAAPAGAFDLAVVSPGISLEHPLVNPLVVAGTPVIGELELGYQQSYCLNVAITGTNGKTTTTELIEKVLTHAHRTTVAAGNIGLPLCDVADRTRELDFLTLEVSSFQLETIHYFRPVVAVLMNLTPDHFDRYTGMADYIRAKARIFMNQQAFDWAIVQFEALTQMQAMKLSIPSKIITFSAQDRQADIFLDRSLLISRIEGWVGPLLDMNHARLRGPHNAENMMAALAVGRVLRLPLEVVAEALKKYDPAPHRCELVAEINGVKYINDSKATNVDAVRKAIQTIPVTTQGQANLWLIAGGKDKGFDYQELAPSFPGRVKGAFLIGETREKLQAAWGDFTQCVLEESLTNAVMAAARQAEPGDTVLLSPACSSFDQFQNYQHRGEVFRAAVGALKNTTDCGCTFCETQHSGAALNNAKSELKETRL